MLFDYAYLLNDFDAEFFSSGLQQPGNIIIPINKTITGRQPELFTTLFHSKTKFSFCITGDFINYSKIFIKEEIVQNFLRLFFLPNYLRSEGKHTLYTNYSGDEEQLFNSLLEYMCNEFKKQGVIFTMLKIKNIESYAENQEKDNLVALRYDVLQHYLIGEEDEKIPVLLIKTFTTPGYFNKRWIVPVENINDFINKKTLLDKLENYTRKTEPLKTALIEISNTAVLNGSNMKTENELLKFKLANNDNYLHLLRKESQGLIHEIESLRKEIHRLTQQIINRGGYGNTTDDPDLIMQLHSLIMAEQNRANETLDWYKKEYEVLPLWYKRGGQVIKVITGKRTFRSLFKKENLNGSKK